MERAYVLRSGVSVETAVADTRPDGSVAMDADSLSLFHAGDRAVVERCYRQHFHVVFETVGRLLPRDDAETVTHEIFWLS